MSVGQVFQLDDDGSWSRAEYDRQRYRAVRDNLVAMLGGECVQCSSTEGLEFDHIDPASKSFTVLSAWNRGDDVLLPELAKCQLLCVDCHRAKTGAALSVEHGGGKSGRRNCKCIPCRERKAEYMRNWKAARKARKN